MANNSGFRIAILCGQWTKYEIVEYILTRPYNSFVALNLHQKTESSLCQAEQKNERLNYRKSCLDILHGTVISFSLHIPSYFPL